MPDIQTVVARARLEFTGIAANIWFLKDVIFKGLKTALRYRRAGRRVAAYPSK